LKSIKGVSSPRAGDIEKRSQMGGGEGKRRERAQTYQANIPSLDEAGVAGWQGSGRTEKPLHSAA